jgi:hypothetical protein
VPGKMDPEEQKSFVKRYKRRYKRLSEDEKVYFLDGCHPTHTTAMRGTGG